MGQERFGKPPEVPRTRPDDEEGQCWASAATLPSDFCASVVDASHQPLGPYLPLMGSLGLDAEAADAPDLQLCVEVHARSAARAHYLHTTRMCCRIGTTWEHFPSRERIWCAQWCVAVTAGMLAANGRSFSQEPSPVRADNKEEEGAAEAAEPSGAPDVHQPFTGHSICSSPAGSEGGDSATSAAALDCSWHATPAWPDIATFSHVRTRPSAT